MCWLAKPVADRVVYKTIKKRRIKSIVEIGLGDGTRCEKMIRAAQTFSEAKFAIPESTCSKAAKAIKNDFRSWRCTSD